MEAPTRNSLTNERQVVIDWMAPVAPLDGDSTVESYHVMWKDSNEAEWVDLIYPEFPYTWTFATAVDNVVQGGTYDFKVRARNIYGFGAFSQTTTIEASTLPDTPEISTVTAVGTQVEISFSVPSDNGSPISLYEVLIRKKDGDLSHNSECDASLQESLGVMSCLVSF
jgi:hypothetical protein